MTKLVVIVGFLISFAAGMMLSHAWQGRPPVDRPTPGAPGGRESWLASQLNLTPDQQTKMKEIWQDSGKFGGRGDPGKRAAIRREQDEQIAALIHPEDKTEYELIIKEHKDKLDALEADGRKAFSAAVEKTKAILSPDQLKKYEELMSRPGPEGRDRGTGPEGRGPDGRGSQGRGHDQHEQQGHEQRGAGRPATQGI